MKSFALRIIGLLAAAAVVLAGGYAIAQVTLPQPATMGVNDRVQIIPNGQPSAGSVYATLNQMRAWVLGGASGHTGTPAITSCGTGSPTIVGTDTAFTITQGTSATGCVATFSTPFVSTPVCVATNQTAPATSTPAYTVTTTAVTLVTASTTGEIWNVICVARSGG
jgi:hypothetical protein